MRVRQQQKSDDHDNRIKERLLQEVVVAKAVAETKGREVIAQFRVSGPTAAIVAETPALADRARRSAATREPRPKHLDRTDRLKVNPNQQGERNARAKVNKILQKAQEAVRIRATMRPEELLALTKTRKGTRKPRS
ncbi:hypothetical protein DVH05_019950 [Phytophthora capsici]|nr:hypothetical protein DVH05_019950 [Phytophthora capsici]